MTAVVLCALVGGCGEGSDESTAATNGPQAVPPPQADWPIFRRDQSLRGVTDRGIDDNLALRWVYPTGGPIRSSPVVADGRVFIGSDDGHIHAVALRDGKRLWRHTLYDGSRPGPVEAPPLIAADTVYIGSADGTLYALSAENGSERWRYHADDRIVGSANTAELPDGRPVILVGSYDNDLHCVDAALGSGLWRASTGYYVNAAPTIHGDQVVFGGCDGKLHIVALADGSSVTQVELDNPIAASVAVADGVGYIGHYADEMVAVDLSAGEIIWRYTQRRAAIFSSAAVDENHVVFGARDQQVHCVRRADGQSVWTFTTRAKVDSSPVIAGNRVIVGSDDGRLYVLDLTDGSQRWSYEIGKPLTGSPAVVGSWVLIGSEDGSLYAFAPAP